MHHYNNKFVFYIGLSQDITGKLNMLLNVAILSSNIGVDVDMCT